MLTEAVDAGFFRMKLKPRMADSHKGDYGTVLIFAGSCGMAGAAVLCGRAALKSGAGLVRFLLPSFSDPLLAVLQVSVPEATCTDERPSFERVSSIAAGSGLGSDPIRAGILRDIISGFSGPLVLDADALNLIASGQIPKELLSSSKASFIMTPHIGEAKRLLSEDKPIQTKEERLSAAVRLCEKYDSVVVLKGHETIIAVPGGRLFVNTTGNPGMATGGSGDVLSGIIASFAAQGLSPADAACCGVFIHGLAGDKASEELSQSCVCAGDIISFLPAAFKSI